MPGSRPIAPDGYELRHRIGRGASSVVWEAVQLSTRRPVALKILDIDLSGEDVERRFERERTLMVELATHPGVLTVLDAGIHAHRPWLALELCHRGSLATNTSREGALAVPAALAVLVRLADALGAAHAAGIVHCDIKPANVMITDFGEPALGDFGIARVAAGGTTTTRGGFSLDHVAPEILNDEHPTTASDVYSLGSTIWEVLAGRPPFRRVGDSGLRWWSRASPPNRCHRFPMSRLCSWTCSPR